MFYIRGGSDEEILKEAGILSRPEYTFRGDDLCDVIAGMARTHVQAFLDLDKKEPGLWSLAQGENSLLLADGYIQENTGLGLELYRAIPVPDQEVSIYDILEFKAKRQDELNNLRFMVDDFIEKLVLAENTEAELAKLVGDIDDACAAIIKVSKEGRLPLRVSNLKVSFSVQPFVTVAAGIAGWHLAASTGLPLVTSALAAAATATAPALKISGDFGFRGLENRTSPYRYVSSIYKELI
jgi:hypothetical protein